MGYTTMYLGYFTIQPALNPVETQWLRAYAEYLRPRDAGTHPYWVPMNPRHPECKARPADPGKAWQEPPSDLCDWGPSFDGRRLEWVERDRSSDAKRWLPYLIDHFLRPGALAAESGRPEFEHFTFDHVVSGVMTAFRHDSGRLFAIVIEDNEVRRVTLSPGWPLDPMDRPYDDTGEDHMDDPGTLIRIQNPARQHGIHDRSNAARERRFADRLPAE